jgi:hypothetical protein
MPRGARKINTQTFPDLPCDAMKNTFDPVGLRRKLVQKSYTLL